VVSSIDHVALTPVWNVWVKEALSQFFIVDQPMLVYLDDEDIKEIKTFVDTKKGYKSVSTNLLPQKLSPPLKTTAQRSAEM
jgi:hypothetical protein